MDASAETRNIPRYSQLPIIEGTGERHSWDVFGRDDELGTLNFIRPETVVKAAHGVQEGRVVCISREAGQVFWITDLNKGRKPKQRAAWSGPVMASGRLVIVSERGGAPRFLERGLGPDGTTALIETGPRDSADPQESADYWQRRRSRDPDLWVIELDIADAERFAAETILGR